MLSRTVAIFFTFLCLLGIPSFAFAFDKIAIFYPEAKEPYRSIYREIITGVTKQDLVTLNEYVLQKSFDANQIAAQLKAEGIDKVIALERLGYKLAKQLPDNFRVVTGALPFSPNGISGISLISEPASLFDYLKQVAPEVDRVHVAYSERSLWLIELAKVAAEEKGLSLSLKQVNSTAEAITFYNGLFDSDMAKNEAIWLPVDRISSHDKVTLPIILEKAWSREIVVFSSKPSHAKRGALFSTYPDNFELGKRLYDMLLELANDPDNSKFSALKDLQLAVNLRTASHLGLKYSSEQKQSFKLTFPE